jgi:hypothetical protein
MTPPMDVVPLDGGFVMLYFGRVDDLIFTWYGLQMGD